MAEQKTPAICCDNFLFLNIFRTFRIAIQPARFFTAFMALAIIVLAGWLMDFSKTVVTSEQTVQRQTRNSRLTGTVTYPTELHCFIGEPERFDEFIKRYGEKSEKQGLFKVASGFCMARLNIAAVSLVTLKFDVVIIAIKECSLAIIWALKYHTIYSIIFILISLIVFTVAGGAICRGAALHFSQGEKHGMTPCIKFSLRKFVSLFFAALVPASSIAVFGLLFITLFGGLTANIPYFGEIFLSVYFIVVLFFGFLTALIAIWAITGGNLMFGVIAYENSDMFDALSKSFVYVCQKPWKYCFYTILAAGYGAIGYLFVRFFAFLTLVMSRSFLSIIIWKDGGKAAMTNKLDVLWPKVEFFNLAGGSIEASKNATEKFAAGFMHLEVLAIAGLVLAIAISFYFTANTVIYCLLRNKNDNTPITDVFIEEEITEAQPEITESSAEQAQSIQQPQ